MENFIAELKWRGLIHDQTPGTEEFMNSQSIAGYLGVDPTSDSMHIGNLVPVMMLVHLQRAGHTPIALVGGATGLVGDPSGKDKERQLQTIEQVEKNAAGIKKQLEHFLEFDKVPNPAIMVNNYDWFKDISFLDFLRDTGKHITINYMMSKESVKKRLQGDTGISYTEFAYQLLQGYDFYHLYHHQNARLQVGGSDQWGNITTGTELIRRMSDEGAKAYAVVCPLMTREDGSKFGKTAGGKSVWLDPEKTSPYEFYQYWINVGDQDAEKYIKIFTLKSQQEIEELAAAHAEEPGARLLQKALAEDLTQRVHGTEGLKSAHILTDFMFGRIKSKEALKNLSQQEWKDVSRSSDVKQVSKSQLEEGIGILDILVETGLTQSKGEARRSIEKDKSIKVNMEACTSIETQLGMGDVFHNTYFYIQKGKKNKFIVELV